MIVFQVETFNISVEFGILKNETFGSSESEHSSLKFRLKHSKDKKTNLAKFKEEITFMFEV